MAPYSNFNGGLVTKHGVATHAWIAILSIRNNLGEKDLGTRLDPKFCDRVNINVRFLDVFFGEFRWNSVNK